MPRDGLPSRSSSEANQTCSAFASFFNSVTSFFCQRESRIPGIIVFEVYTEIFRFQIADMTIARHNLIVLSEELLDGFALAGDSTITKFFCISIFCWLEIGCKTYTNN